MKAFGGCYRFMIDIKCKIKKVSYWTLNEYIYTYTRHEGKLIVMELDVVTTVAPAVFPRPSCTFLELRSSVFSDLDWFFFSFCGLDYLHHLHSIILILIIVVIIVCIFFSSP